MVLINQALAHLAMQPKILGIASQDKPNYLHPIAYRGYRCKMKLKNHKPIRIRVNELLMLNREVPHQTIFYASASVMATV